VKNPSFDRPLASGASKPLPRLLLVIPYPLPSAAIYIIKPLTELERQNRLRFSVVTESETTVARLQASDLVLFCRNIEPSADWILEECLLRNIPTIYHLDDNLWEVPEGLNYTDYFHAPERLQQLERFLSRVDLVRVYSQPLVERALQFNSNVNLVLPCIDMSLVPRAALPRRHDKVRITYATGRGNGDTLISLFSQDLLKLMDAYPDAAEMHWWGEVPAGFRHHPSSRLVHIIHNYDQYLHYLSHEGFDIGLAPLTPTPFNRSKTNTKFRDYGACRIPGIYSAVDVYSSCVEHEKTGLLVDNTPGSWFDALKRLLIDADLREEIKEAAFEYVDRNYRQELVERQWLEVIDTLLGLQKRVNHQPPGPLARPMQLSLVEQANLLAGFIGVGMQPGPGVHLIADPGSCLPFATGSVDALFSDWPLERSKDPELVLHEFYRVARHGAQVSILTGYTSPMGGSEAAQSCYFNEETPRLWTCAEPPVYQIQPGFQDTIVTESAPARTAVPAIDLRCLGMEFFYAPSALSLPDWEKRRLRRQDSSMCQRILYRCAVIKGPATDAELQQWAKASFPDSPQVIAQRWHDANEVLKDGIFGSDAQIRSLQARLEAQEIELNTCQAELNQQMPLAKLLAREIDAYRNRKAIRLIERFVDRVDYSARLPLAYRQIYDDSLIYAQPLKGFWLRPSINLQRVPYLAYPVRLQRSGLDRLLFVAVIDLCPRSGTVGLQILRSGQVLASASLPAPNIRVDEPLAFRFYPLNIEAGELLEMRIFAQELDIPLRVYEWHHYPFFGLGKLQSKPFCSFHFHSEE
jgi:glycosyltransferase involved in cell wall biosynthesis